jgi:Tol biopolymer transport system component
MRVNIPRALLVIVLLAAAGSWRLATSAQGVTEAERQLQKAILLETVEGNLQAAIDQYKKIVAENGGNRALAARALLRLAGCYEKLGVAEAQKIYQQLINDYSDQTAEVTLARQKLAALRAVHRETSSLPTLRLVWGGANVDPLGAISPDGRLLAYVDWNTGDLAVRDLRLGQSHMVTNKGGNWKTDDYAFSPRWSPDGKRLAYYWYQGKAELNELRITDLSGKNVRVVYSSPRADGRWVSPVGWFPDGSALLGAVYRRGYATEIVRVSLDNGDISPVWKVGSIGASRVCLSSDGRYVAFDAPPDSESLNTDVFVMPASGGRPVPVVSGPHDDRLLDWTPDGRRVLVASNRSGAYDAWSMQVDGGRAEGSPLLLRKDLGMVFPIGFSPDGSFYFAPDVGVRDVVLVDWNVESQKAASAPALATEHFSGSTRLPAWSPDGRKLAYLVDHGFLRPAEARLRIHDMETGAERTLVDVNGSVYSLSWSPDGTSVAMTVTRAQSASVCRVLDVTSGKLIRQFASPRMGYGVYNFVWSPEGDVVYYVAMALGGRTTLLRHDLRTGDEVTLYTGGAGVPIDIAVSPDGRHVAVAHAKRVVLIAATGGEPHELVSEAVGRRAADTLAWSPDGKYVYFGRQLQELQGAIRLYRVVVAGGAPEDLNLEIGEELRFRPDGRRLAFTRLEGELRKLRGEIWVMENFLPAAKGAR